MQTLTKSHRCPTLSSVLLFPTCKTITLREYYHSSVFVSVGLKDIKLSLALCAALQEEKKEKAL